MSTGGNLELRLYGSTLCASTPYDGYTAYDVIPQLADFLNSVKNPTELQFKQWFLNVSGELFTSEYSNCLIGGAADEVVIDMVRNLILHTDGLEHVAESYPAKFENAKRTLTRKYKFEILSYRKLTARKFGKK